jgi:anti-sigma regulatory factor (Ser/Thr protein kinase)
MIGLKVGEMSQTGEARRLAADVAERVGLDAGEVGRLSLIVTEAATNLVKHARSGEIVLWPVEEKGARAVVVLALDRGPGMLDLDRCLGDGFSSSGSMGTGLGAIRRLSTEFDAYSSETGTILVSRVGSTSVAAVALEAGAVSIPHPGEDTCGDAWALVHREEGSLALVVDGLGHGADAHHAAREAVRVLEEHGGLQPAEILERIHERLRATRGAVAGVMELNRRERVARFAGVGNISGVIVSDGTSKNVVSHHGTLGHVVRKFHEFVYPWPEGSLVVLHSDGVSAHWDLQRYPGLASRHPLLIAAALYRDFHRAHDDATVLAIREAA